MTIWFVRQMTLTCILCLCLAGVTPASADNTHSHIPTPASLLDKLRGQGFDDQILAQILSDPRIELYPQILEKRGKGINYFHRRFGLLTSRSVARGRQVMTDNSSFFEQLEGSYGVEKETIVAIFRVETNLGKHIGNYPVFNSLLTRATLPNRRSEWAEDELVRLLVICRREGRDPLSVKGSWAGAFGLCQFIPSSYLTYGVDGNGDHAVDLFDFADAMASIANYLKENGWGNSDDKRKKAIYAYNHCDSYVKAVMAYANACKTPPRKRDQKRRHGRGRG